METPKTHSIVLIIAKYAFADEVRQKSMIVLFTISALFVFLLRECYKGDYMVNGQALSADAISWTLSKVIFHVIAAGAMFIAALLTMRVFKRDREEGMLSCIMAKPIDRWQYVTGKILGLWALSVLFMFILHGIVFFIASLSMKTLVPAYLVASLLCSINLLFVVLTVFLLSLMLPDIVAFLCAVGIGLASLAANSIYTLSDSRPTAGDDAAICGSRTIGLYRVASCLRLMAESIGTQQSASSLIGNDGGGPVYPLMNVLFYCLILGILLFLRFRNEEIV